ncbi:transcription termination factor 4, mitochondrial-like [Branchiostoma floridae x Branchiostoma japonicum]
MILLYTYGNALRGTRVFVPGAHQLLSRMFHARRCFLPICSLQSFNTANHRQVLCLNQPVMLHSTQRLSCRSFLRKESNSSLWTICSKDAIKCAKPQPSLFMPSALKHSEVTCKGKEPEMEDARDSQTTEELVSSILTCIEETPNISQKIQDLRIRDSVIFWVSCLLEIGCTQKQIYHFMTTNAHLLFSPEDKVKEVFGQFLYLDISKNKVMDLLSTHPEILREQPTDLKRKVQNLQKYVSSVENVAKMILKCPSVLTLSVSKVRRVVAVLKENCQFKTAQVQTILTTTPVVLLETPEHAELLFQYAFLAMGSTRGDMVKAFLFRHKWQHIRSRHMFLERRGMYQPPDKKGKTKKPNPHLRDILATTTKEFLTQVAFASYEEYATFVSLLEQERETDVDTSDMSSSDDDSEDTDEDTEVETDEDTDEETDDETTER